MAFGASVREVKMEKNIKKKIKESMLKKCLGVIGNK
jgi:hypothetical protein